MKKIGLIMTEDSQEAWSGEKGIGQYFLQQFRKADDSLDYEVIHGVTGTLPTLDAFPQYSGFVFSGSHHSVNDPYQWVRNLENFILQIVEHNKKSDPIKLVGICYGHQLIGKALGGRVQKITHPKKFLFGSEKIDATDSLYDQTWFKEVFGDRKSFRIMEVHGEEVTILPDGASVVGQSESCKNEVMTYGDHILSFQGHPEFTKETMAKIAERLVKHKEIDEEASKEGKKSALEGEPDLLVKLVCKYLNN